MKQLRIFSALLMCLFALSFAGCSKEDDEGIGTQFEKELLFGGWKYEIDTESTVYYFSSEDDGCILVENANSENYKRFYVTYSVNKEVTTLTLTGAKGKKEEYTIFSLTKRQLVVENSEQRYTFERYIGNIEDEYPYKHEAVDLGLSVKWACCNVGATSPEEYGDYFAWGETTPKSEYTEENCKTWKKNIGDISGNAAYDAATANWGGSWRMPTSGEMQELRKNCTWQWTTVNGVTGYKVTGPNGNSIFLPVAGYRYGSSLDDADGEGYYWSSSPYESTYSAYGLGFDSGDYGYGWLSRSYGLSVRSVKE